MGLSKRIPPVASAGFFHFAGDAPFAGTALVRFEGGTQDSGSWLTVGPTGSGAGVIWTALDAVPVNATGIRVNVHGYAAHGTNAAGMHEVKLKVRKAGSAVAPEWAIWVLAYLTNEVNIQRHTFDIPLSASRTFQMYWYRDAQAGGYYTLQLYLEGWYV